MKKLSENQKLSIVSLIAIGSIFYIFKNKNSKTLEGIEGLNIDLDGDKLSSSIGAKLRNNPELVKSLGKSFLNNEKVQNGAKNLATKAFVKLMSK